MIHGKNPEHVAIVAMGASAATYVKLATSAGGYRGAFDEVWAISAMGGVIQHDRCFMMDDLPRQLAPGVKDNPYLGQMLTWARTHPGPIYTSTPYPEYPGTVRYPLGEVLEAVGAAYFNSTVAYAVGFAFYLGVKNLALYGCDFTYPNRERAEKGRGCVEFLLGMAMARGINISVPADGTLLDACVADKDRFYGYPDPPVAAVPESMRGVFAGAPTPE